mmetsp:Transcript_30444/g.71012  ORF Transcript_30444/g.71012 Transcript_30444/m.71012 type:complete len:81 (+) Transcript_30444:681-923(+)
MPAQADHGHCEALKCATVMWQFFFVDNGRVRAPRTLQRSKTPCWSMTPQSKSEIDFRGHRELDLFAASVARQLLSTDGPL